MVLCFDFFEIHKIERGGGGQNWDRAFPMQKYGRNLAGTLVPGGKWDRTGFIQSWFPNDHKAPSRVRSPVPASSHLLWSHNFQSERPSRQCKHCTRKYIMTTFSTEGNIAINETSISIDTDWRNLFIRYPLRTIQKFFKPRRHTML